MRTKNILIISIIVSIILFLTIQLGCDYPVIDPINPENIAPSVAMDTVINITATSAKFIGNIIDEGSSSLISKGFFWDTVPDPDMENYLDSILIQGSNTGQFSSIVVGLESDKTYYVTAYATNIAGYNYDTDKSFVTEVVEDLPTVSLESIASITESSFIVYGNVIHNGNLSVSARGFSYNVAGDPSLINGTNIPMGIGMGAFDTIITGLDPHQRYYVTTHAINELGTSYGLILDTLTLPHVETLTTVNITSNSATCDGKVSGILTGEILERGICYSTSPFPLPDISGLHIFAETNEIGEFSVDLVNLSPYTSYIFRAYATNNSGTGYGDTIIFRTISGPCPGIESVLYEGQTYNTVSINGQCWLKENLNIGTMINGSSNQSPQNPEIIEKYCFLDEPDSCDTYGGLYQWDEMMQYTGTAGNQGICPNNWHIPSDAEWLTLITTLGGEGIAGGKMKEVGLQHWLPYNTGATNECGFTALPGGDRSTNACFYSINEWAFFWSSSKSDPNYSWGLRLIYDNQDVFHQNYDKTYGYSVRCIKDE